MDIIIIKLAFRKSILFDKSRILVSQKLFLKRKLIIIKIRIAIQFILNFLLDKNNHVS